MKVFILEDDDNRINFIKKNFSKFAELIFAVDIIEAKQYFNFKEKYDLIMLDHDLGGKVYVDTKEENTGSEFCRFIGAAYQFKDVPIIIHSHNSVGADVMFSILTRNEFKDIRVLCFANFVNFWNRGTLAFLGHYIYEE